jgi:hypothetical protein
VRAGTLTSPSKHVAMNRAHRPAPSGCSGVALKTFHHRVEGGFWLGAGGPASRARFGYRTICRRLSSR